MELSQMERGYLSRMDHIETFIRDCQNDNDKRRRFVTKALAIKVDDPIRPVIDYILCGIA